MILKDNSKMKSLKNKMYTFKCPKCLLDKIDNEGMQKKQGIRGCNLKNDYHSAQAELTD